MLDSVVVTITRGFARVSDSGKLIAKGSTPQHYAFAKNVIKKMIELGYEKIVKGNATTFRRVA